MSLQGVILITIAILMFIGCIWPEDRTDQFINPHLDVDLTPY